MVWRSGGRGLGACGVEISDESSSALGDSREGFGGEEDRGRIIARSRVLSERRGREESVCVVARRRERQMQW